MTSHLSAWRWSVPWALLLAGGLAAAQSGVLGTEPRTDPQPPVLQPSPAPTAGTPAASPDQGAPVPVPRINRNPVYRENLPPAQVTPDPRDSSTRPVQLPGAQLDDERTVVPPSAMPAVPASAPAAATPGR